MKFAIILVKLANLPGMFACNVQIITAFMEISAWTNVLLAITQATIPVKFVPNNVKLAKKLSNACHAELDFC